MRGRFRRVAPLIDLGHDGQEGLGLIHGQVVDEILAHFADFGLQLADRFPLEAFLGVLDGVEHEAAHDQVEAVEDQQGQPTQKRHPKGKLNRKCVLRNVFILRQNEFAGSLKRNSAKSLLEKM